MTVTPTVQGTCAPGFENVRAEFARNFAERGEVGAALAVTLGGETVVDLWGGYADAGGTRPWERDTLVNVYSTSKGMTSLCAHLLADRGELDLDAPVSRYWPEFAQAGKGDVPVRWLLSHRAGLIGPRERLTPEDVHDWEKTCAVLAATEPWWEPGTAQGYHAVSFGFLVGEVVRRITGVSLGTFLRTEITEPLGADLYIGTPASEHHRCAQLIGPDGDGTLSSAFPGVPDGTIRSLDAHPFAPLALAMRHLPTGDVNSAACRSAEIPAANGNATARGLAAVYRALVEGELVGPGTLASLRERQSRPGETDLVLGAFAPDASLPFAWACGYMLNTAGFFGPNQAAFGHGGAGGSLAFADLENRLAYAYVMNKFEGGTTGDDTRNLALVNAVYAAPGLAGRAA
ncbi:serine hydrolase domain-containing protein [Streptomyces sp. NRRL F-5755]|uniref:serine hydrolase domain-containing protein n=1 Tax=Streptomyces sp. NRRL F-5755 TaxID=1519475 RepID=UPI0006AEAB27|nr:serine hydrolase domain-containing protein [Streptomyces sp. NRRL F-5755]